MRRNRLTPRVQACLGTLLLTPILLLSQVFSYPKAADPKQLAIMAWGPSPSTPVQLQYMHEAGFNISGFCKVEDLENIAKAGLNCFVSDPRAKGYDWEKLPDRETIKKNAVDLKTAIGGSKAALGILLTDEPSGDMLPGVAEVFGILRQQMPAIWPYVNGFPLNAGRPRIGSMSYEDYLRAQVRQIGQPFLSYDQYSIRDGAIGDPFFANLEIARRISLELKTPFWNCILATALPGYMDPSAVTLSVQAYSTLAYGGRGIAYFTYVRPDETDFSDTAVDGFGNRTPTWDLLRRLNGEILTLAPILTKLHSTGVYHYPTAFEPEQTDSLVVDTVRLASAGKSAASILVGEFADDQDRRFLMVVNRNLAAGVTVGLRLVDKDRKLKRISPYSGEPRAFDLENGESLGAGGGMLLAID